jgi:hyperosmotically inducible protein
MERKLHNLFIVALAAASLTTLQAAENNTPTPTEQRIQKEVRHELLMLPYYNVFDNLEFAVNGRTVTLMGQVTWPTLKSDAGNVVKKIEGVDKVVNNIQVLPPSPMDDHIRVAELLHIYSTPGFEKYAIQPVPSIHIIVDNGRVTLEGVVDSKSDKDIAGIRANGVPGTFEVTNNLRVQKG